MLYPSVPRLAASVVVLAMLLVTLACYLQLLAFVCFAVAAMPYLLEVLNFDHLLSCKVFS